MMRTISVLSVFALLVAVTASASVNYNLAVEIPFDFYVGEKTMPAGRYEFQMSRASGAGVVTIRNTARSLAAMVGTAASGEKRADGKSLILFHRYGDTFFLTEIWEGTMDTGRKLSTSRKEKEIARATGQTPMRLAMLIERK